jgi:nucleoside-diphosphate-sugar epimerase
MTNLVAACRDQRARMVFVDNLYMYGPQTDPLREDMPLTDYGVKPSVRSDVTRIWQRASKAGELLVAALRAPDFYGPGVAQSHLGETAFGSIARGKNPTLVLQPDIPHAFAYVPDIARAVVTLLDAPDDAFNQVWHVPCASVRSPHQILELGAAAFGTKLKIVALPLWLLPLLGVVSPTLREFREMGFVLGRPYQVGARKFSQRFWSDATPFEVGAPATLASLMRGH